MRLIIHHSYERDIPSRHCSAWIEMTRCNFTVFYAAVKERYLNERKSFPHSQHRIKFLSLRRKLWSDRNFNKGDVTLEVEFRTKSILRCIEEQKKKSPLVERIQDRLIPA